MTSGVGSEAQQVRDLLVKDRLHELEMAYCRGVDRRDRELLRSIFFDDAIEEHGGMFSGTADEFVDWVFTDFLPGFEVTAHYVLNEWYRVDGPRADGETHRISYHRPTDPAGQQRFAACRTFTRYEERGGVWRIVHRSVTRDWIIDHGRDVDLVGGAFGMPLSLGGPDDLSYAKLPLFGRGPVDRAG